MIAKTDRPLTLALAAGLGFAVLSHAAPSRAQSSDAQVAGATLFDEAKKLMAEGRNADACPKLEEANRIAPGMGTLYWLSSCYEAINKTASAWIGFRDLAAMALAAGQAEREKVARGKVAALEPKLMKLRITVQGAGIEVKRDGAIVSPALWGTAVPLDPGRHVVSASAPGKDPWETTVSLDRPGGVITVEVPQLAERKGGPPPPPPPNTGDKTTTPPPPDTPPVLETNPRPWQLPVAITATIVGAGGLGLGVAFGFLAKAKQDESNMNGCVKDTTMCTTTTGLNLRNEAVTRGNIGTGVFIGGAVLAAAGIVLWATAPSSKPAATAKSGAAWIAMPEIGIGPGNLAVRAKF